VRVSVGYALGVREREIAASTIVLLWTSLTSPRSLVAVALGSWRSRGATSWETESFRRMLDHDNRFDRHSSILINHSKLERSRNEQRCFGQLSRIE